MLEHKGTQALTTPRLCLRKYALTDAEGIFMHYAKDERVTRFLSWKPYSSIEEVATFIAQTMDTYAHQNVYHWLIAFNGEPVGSISAITVDERNHSCELGYCIGYDYWHQGIVSEAALAVMRFLFYEVHAHRIYAKHDVENPASGKVMQKCFMAYEGRLKGHYCRHDGTYSDALLYGVLAEDFSKNISK